MRLLAVILSSLAAVTAQQLLVYGDNALPTCAQSCTVLQSAQTGCLPPSAPVTDDVTYESCFCQSGYLTTLKTSASTLCSDVCDASDVTKISTWFQANCADNGVAAAAVMSTATATATAPSSSSVVASSLSTNTPGNNAVDRTSGTDTGKDNGWFSTHWRWVVMIIVIFIGCAILATVLIILRRRFHRREDLARQPFNQGITDPPVPVIAITPATSKSSLPRGREKDRAVAHDEPMPHLPSMNEETEWQGSDTPDVERAKGKLPKYN